jgi:hypothetical protein
VPWEQRSKIGLFQGYWQTSKAVMFSPGESFERLAPETGRWWDPLSYAIVSSYLGISGIFMFYLFIGGLAAIAARMDKSPMKIGASEGTLIVVIVAAALLGFLLFVPIASLMTVFIWGGIEHLTLKLVGVNTRGFEATLRGSCYAQAPMVIGVIPMCGSYVYPVWQIVCKIFAYRGVHKTSGGKATAAVLLPVALCCGGGIALWALSMAATYAATGLSNK